VNLEGINKVFFIGIGGIGMSALARYFNRKGFIVAGYDKVSTSLTDELIIEGIDIHFLDDTMNLPEWAQDVSAEVLIVYTPAIPKDHNEYNFLKDVGFVPMKRSEVLGMITKESVTVAVAGTHGKTTTSSLLAHIFTETKFGCNAFLGGIATNYNSNVLVDPDSNTVVVEADEYDRSFLTLYPDVAIVTSMDADHLDVYGEKDQLEESFKLFVDQIKEGGKLIRKAGLPLNEGITYSITGDADYQAVDIAVHNGQYKFNLKYPGGIINDVTVGLPGSHNVENAIAAFAVACELGIETGAITKALHSFQGVKRRFEYHIKSADLVYIDDYAHHPEELRACIQSVREMYPDKKITGVFQPHLYSRTRDFADGFAESLSELNEVILLDIYPARELPIEGITSAMLLDKIISADKLLLGKKEVVEDLKDRQLEVLLTLGAGDIDELVKPIKEGLEARI
jgi:UDP-N-acetylmuramate--alanine ligase